MASRRKKPEEGGVSLDSLMDALTNVVAVLILILILLQVDVSNTVGKLLGELKPATPEQLETARQTHADLLSQIARQQATLAAPAPDPEALLQAERDLALLEKSDQENQQRLLELNRLRQLAEKTRADADAEKRKTDTLVLEIARLEALLDQTPKPAPPPSTIVRIPNSRPIPEDANLYYCYIHGDQAHFVDTIDLKTRVMDLFDRNKRDFVHERVKVARKPDRIIYDQQKVVDFFAQQDLNIRKQTHTVPFNKPWTRLNARIEFDPKNGDASLEDMNRPKGRFHNICNLLSSYPRRVLIFKVHPNGFATYLKAREIADSYRIPSGWEIDGNTAVNIPLDFEVNRLEQPPPPDPDAPKPPPAPPAPPAPKRQLD